MLFWNTGYISLSCPLQDPLHFCPSKGFFRHFLIITKLIGQPILVLKSENAAEHADSVKEDADS